MTARFRLNALILKVILAGLLVLSALPLPAPALAVSDDPVLRRMDTVLEENARLREEAWKAHKNRDQDAAHQAAEALTASEDRLERTRAEALAHVANVSPAQVEALRKDGRSWGQAAGELGVHPGFLGIGKVPMYESRPVRKASKAETAEEGKPQGKRGKGKAGAKDTDKAPAPKGKTAKTSAGKNKTAEPKAKAAAAKKTGKGSETRIKGAETKAKDQPEKKARKAKKKVESS